MSIALNFRDLKGTGILCLVVRANQSPAADFFGAFDLNDVSNQERLGARVHTNLDYYSGNYIALTAFILLVRSATCVVPCHVVGL